MVLKPYEWTQWTFQKQNNILEKTSRHSLIFNAALRNIWRVNAAYLRAKFKFLSLQYFLFVLLLLIWVHWYIFLVNWNLNAFKTGGLFSPFGRCSLVIFEAESRFDWKPVRVLRSLRISKISKLHLNTIELIAFKYYFRPTCEFSFILFRSFVNGSGGKKDRYHVIVETTYCSICGWFVIGLTISVRF